MYARVTTSQGNPGNFDAGTKAIRDEVVPAVSQIAGFRGILVLGDPASGKSVSITLWTDQDAMQRSEQAANQLRNTSSAAIGATVLSVDRFEVIASEMPSPQLT